MTAVLFSTHYINDDILNRYYNLVNVLPTDKYNVYFCLNDEDNSIEIPIDIEYTYKWSYNQIESELGFNYKILDKEKPYDGRVFLFWLSFLFGNHKYCEKYDKIWFVEYDCIFNGNWKDCICYVDDKLPNTELILTNVFDVKDELDWYWYNHCNESFTDKNILNDLVGGLFCISRLSTNICKLILDTIKTGIHAHQELLIPSIINQNGYDIVSLTPNPNTQSVKYISECLIDKFYLNDICLFNYTVLELDNKDNYDLSGKLLHAIK